MIAAIAELDVSPSPPGRGGPQPGSGELALDQVAGGELALPAAVAPRASRACYTRPMRIHMDVPLNAKVAPGNTLRLRLVDDGAVVGARFQLTIVGELERSEPPAEIDGATANALLLMSQLLGPQR